MTWPVKDRPWLGGHWRSSVFLAVCQTLVLQAPCAGRRLRGAGMPVAGGTYCTGSLQGVYSSREWSGAAVQNSMHASTASSLCTSRQLMAGRAMQGRSLQKQRMVSSCSSRVPQLMQPGDT